ncbi:hypothetical protein AMTR_s00144p00100340 [Amborella trichopoda]|uniref:Uncharacterized protein n=1 Tax=Amborella trichopoda TaxID=13333 RepID=W1P7Q7_AMBTC|nr:hypothetical protein AMTR_s00144p00100340 [Amborella trichopoda]
MHAKLHKGTEGVCQFVRLHGNVSAKHAASRSGQRSNVRASARGSIAKAWDIIEFMRARLGAAWQCANAWGQQSVQGTGQYNKAGDNIANMRARLEAA